MSARKYVLSLTAVLYLFMILSLALWYGEVKAGFTQGDLQRMGSFTYSKPLTEEIHYPKHHTEFSDCTGSESFDVITVGDSFMNGTDGGSFPDCLTNEYGLRVLNARFVNHSLGDLYILLNSGILDEVRPKAVILESVEREVQIRLGEQIVKVSDYTEAVPFMAQGAPNILRGIFPPVMIQANLKYIFSKVYHFFKPEKLSPEVYITELDRPFFTNPGQERTLIHYYEDLDYLTAPLNIGMVNQNLNNAARLLKAIGISLIFFAAADKYDLYYPYIKDKKARPQNPFFPAFRQVTDREYIFVDTMKILREALERGEQDIYWFGDTHWSHKGIKLVCDELVKYIHGR
ncbi:MAG: hypothetical protein IJG37_01580 [Synergistaceae bacterium]|nr:hypothetical protein [Synergistaceae bacterium]